MKIIEKVFRGFGILIIVFIIGSPVILGPEILIDGLLQYSTRLFVLYMIVWLSTGITGGLIICALANIFE